VEIGVDDWPSSASEAVDYVEVRTKSGSTRIAGQSVYWAYSEGDHWVVGGAPLGYGVPAPEILVYEDGRQEARSIRYVPDLYHRSVKLGWWWPDEPRRPVDGERGA
jgi:hypothetical protein